MESVVIPPAITSFSMDSGTTSPASTTGPQVIIMHDCSDLELSEWAASRLGIVQDPAQLVCCSFCGGPPHAILYKNGYYPVHCTCEGAHRQFEEWLANYARSHPLWQKGYLRWPKRERSI